MNPANTFNPVAEMGRFIRASISLCRTKCRFAELSGWEAAEDIQADVVAQQNNLRDQAYSAEQSDLEAIKLLRAAAADGFNQADLPAVEQAIRLITRSAEHDHNISDATR